MMKIGTPYSKTATRVMLLGSGELGKEVAIELIRLGVEVHACDSYPNAPAMQVAQNSHVFDMLDERWLNEYINLIKPHYIVPEVEAIATQALTVAEREGITVIPNAKAIQLTMNREGIRKLAAEELKLPTSKYKFASTEQEFAKAVHEIGMPCIVKPIMSSSGKGQSVVSSFPKIGHHWKKAQEEGRAGGGKVIVEEIIDFDYEITLLTVVNSKGTIFCEPIGHRQVDGDYVESWQPCEMNITQLKKAKDIATKITDALDGYGVFGVELFIKGDEVYFSEVSPRPHDTGLVTIVSQDQSEFELHAKALLGLPINSIKLNTTAASAVIKPLGVSDQVEYDNLDEALDEDNVKLRLFGKPSINGKRRMGVVVAGDEFVNLAKQKAKRVVGKIKTVM
ncbi:formate-dependent phosphoribosylglycinamide formyltransferase [Verrucomicrobia bacterium]|nr:formate-dependent phosphoribosylglycinamide formyltransferase [Verrucomicrobiota bacterium]